MGEQNVKLIEFETSKMGTTGFKHWEAKLQKGLTEDRKSFTKYRDALLTLENYCERYVPLVVLNTMMELMQPVLDD